MSCDDPFLYHRAHFLKLKEGQGLIQVLVNSDVGTWHGKQKNIISKTGQSFSVNSMGDLIEYAPAVGKKEFAFSVCKNGEAKVWNVIENRELVPAEKDGAEFYKIALMPGGGAFLFVGKAGQYSELIRSLEPEAALSPTK